MTPERVLHAGCLLSCRSSLWEHLLGLEASADHPGELQRSRVSERRSVEAAHPGERPIKLAAAHSIMLQGQRADGTSPSSSMVVPHILCTCSIHGAPGAINIGSELPEGRRLTGWLKATNSAQRLETRQCACNTCGQHRVSGVVIFFSCI